MKLSQSQINEFFDSGFIIIENIFNAMEIDELRISFDELKKMADNVSGKQLYKGAEFVVFESEDVKNNTLKRIQRISWCGAAVPRLLEYGSDPRLLQMASQLLGSNSMNQLINQAHFKSGGDGIAFPWHQDSQHRRYGTNLWTDVNSKGSYVQIIIALDDITKENGPLLFIPGSSKLGHLYLHDEMDDHELNQFFDSRTAVPGLMSAGSAVLFGPYTIHGSRPNMSSLSRRVFINGYAYPGANKRVYPGNGAGRLLEFKE